MSLPPIVSREEWVEARRALLVEEKALTRRRDALNTRRRLLPMVEITKEYVFDGPEGKLTLLDMFGEYRQLVVVHFMFDPSWNEGCSSCTAGADEVSDGFVRHLHARDTELVYVSRAPLAKLDAYKARRGWTFAWFSSYDSDFNYDFHVSLDETIAPVEYNYRTQAEMEEAAGVPVERRGQRRPAEEAPGRSYFLRVGDRVFHTYSVFARGMESVGGSYYFLDETVLGRQEEWEDPKGRVESAYSATPNFSTDEPGDSAA